MYQKFEGSAALSTTLHEDLYMFLRPSWK